MHSLSMPNLFFGGLLFLFASQMTGMSHVDEPKGLLHSCIEEKQKCQQNHVFRSASGNKISKTFKKSKVEMPRVKIAAPLKGTFPK